MICEISVSLHSQTHALRPAQRVERWVLFYLPPLLFMGLIFYVSSRSWVPIPLPSWVIIRDKIVHAMEYGVLCYLWIRAFRMDDKRPIGLRVYVAAALIASAYAVSDEYHQSFVPGRFATIGDVIADSVGAILAATVLLWRQRWHGAVRSFEGT